MKKLIIVALALCLMLPIAASAKCVTASVTAENSFTEWLDVWPGHVDVGISGTWVGTVTVQRKLNSSDTVLDVDTFTSNFQGYFTVGSGQAVRVGVKTGDYTSGTVVITVCQDRP